MKPSTRKNCIIIIHHHYHQIPIVWLAMLSIVSLLEPALTIELPTVREPVSTNEALVVKSSLPVPLLAIGNSISNHSNDTNDSGSTSSSSSLSPIPGTIQQSTNGTLAANASVAQNPAAAAAAAAGGSSNGSLSSPPPDNSASDGDRATIITVISANIVIFIIGFIGNSVVILVIFKFTKIETVTDIYILNLAVADLMFITGLIFLVTTMTISHWIFGNLMCKLYMATTSLNQFASSLLLVVMSFDRYLAVCHPIYAQRFRRIKRAKIICLCIWIVCLILMSPIFAFAKISADLTCAIFWPEYKNFNCEVAFTLYSFAIGFAVPLFLIAIFYLCVIRKLRIAASRGTSLGSARRSRSRENTNRRIEHLVIGIIFTYTICWLPYWITQLCVSFITGNKQPVRGFYGIVLTASSLSYTNSALNPILYAFLSDNFKRRCSDILRSIYSLKIFQTCLGFRRATSNNTNNNNNNNNNNCNYNNIHGYHAPAPTTTACCETEITRPDPRPNQLYLDEFNHHPGPGPYNNDHNNSTNNRDPTMGPLALAAAADDDTIGQPMIMDHENGTGSSTIAIGDAAGGPFDNTRLYQQQHQTTKLSRGVNFVGPNAVTDVIDDNPKNYHKICHDKRTHCQGV